MIASRNFRRPRQGALPRFRILALSERRRAELVRKAGLEVETENELIGQLLRADSEVRYMATNPMFLGLLCEFMRDGGVFPTSTHIVFERYFELRLTRDDVKLRDRFRTTSGEVRAAAEAAAFAMATDERMGLNPTRADLIALVKRLGFPLSSDLERRLDALEFIKLARGDPDGGGGDDRHFTFGHRRFGEYFATCVVLREPGRVTPLQLLTEPHWRETAVVLFQSQQLEQLDPLFNVAASVLRDSWEDLKREAFCVDTSTADERPRATMPVSLPWPKVCLHVLGVLQDGLSNRVADVPTQIREEVQNIVDCAFSCGILYDKTCALQVAGPMPHGGLLEVMRTAISSGSQLLRDLAFQQARMLGDLPPDISHWIRASLVELTMRGRIHEQREATFAFIRRLDRSGGLQPVLRLLLQVRTLDLCLCCLYFMSVLLASRHLDVPAVLTAIVAILAASWTFRMAWMVNAARRGGPVSTALRRWIAPRVFKLFRLSPTLKGE